MTERSYNGWPASETLKTRVIEPVPGVKFRIVDNDNVATIFTYVAQQYNARVEPLKGPVPDDWGFSYRADKNDPTQLSCHASGTALDFNAEKHGNGIKDTFTAAQIVEMQKIIAEVDHTVQCGEFYKHTTDGMHWEINVPPGHLQETARKIRRMGGEVKPPAGKGIVVTTANIDFAKSDQQHKKYLAYLVNLGAILLTQEAKKIQLRNFLPQSWHTMQRIATAARRGSAVSWKTPIGAHKASLRLLSVPSARVGGRLRIAKMFPRYMSVLDLKVDGHPASIVSAHYAPIRYRFLWAQSDRRLAALIIEKVHQGRSVLVGADFNTRPLFVAVRLNKILAGTGITVKAVGDGKIDGFIFVGFDVTAKKVSQYGRSHGLTDHPSVTIHAAITKG